MNGRLSCMDIERKVDLATLPFYYHFIEQISNSYGNLGSKSRCLSVTSYSNNYKFVISLISFGFLYCIIQM